MGRRVGSHRETVVKPMRPAMSLRCKHVSSTAQALSAIALATRVSDQRQEFSHYGGSEECRYLTLSVI